MRFSKKDYIGQYLAALPRFFLGLSMLPPHLLIDNLMAKTFSVLLFLLLALFSGKKIRLLYFFTFISFITAFHLITPWGRVLMEIGPLTITEGSLRTGLGKSLTLVGIVFLSLAIVRPELHLPGCFGQLVSGCLRYFEGLFEHRKEFVKKVSKAKKDTSEHSQKWNIYTAIDEFLLERFNPAVEHDAAKQNQTQKKPPLSGQKAQLKTGLATIAVILIPWWLWLAIPAGA